jgi:hypothetical protein
MVVEEVLDIMVLLQVVSLEDLVEVGKEQIVEFVVLVELETSLEDLLHHKEILEVLELDNLEVVVEEVLVDLADLQTEEKEFNYLQHINFQEFHLNPDHLEVIGAPAEVGELIMGREEILRQSHLLILAGAGLELTQLMVGALRGQQILEVEVVPMHQEDRELQEVLDLY